MPAIVTNNIRVLSANQFLNAFQNRKYEPWVTATANAVGDVVFNGSYKYIATTAGTTGVTAPAHTSGTVSDGGVSWLFVETFDSTANFRNNLYVGIGRDQSWDNPGAGDETPITPVDDDQSKYTRIANIIAAKRLEASSVMLAVKRHDWDASGATVYSEYDPTVADMNYATPVYVYAGSNLYKCLNNNSGAASITQPTGTSTDPFVTPGDGYLWQFMATVSPSDAIQFLTAGYVPVELKLSDDGSAQWNTQQNAKKLSLSTIKVTAGGSGYTTAPITVTAPPSGTTAVASAIIQGGVITGIQMSVVGNGYTTAPTITIGGDGSGATAVAILAPKGGHGSNVLEELDARYAVVNARFDDTEGGYFPVSGENDFRQIQLILDPSDVNGNEATAPRYIGADHSDWDGAETSGKSELMKGSGATIYIENIGPVVRSPGQIEDVKIVLKF